MRNAIAALIAVALLIPPAFLAATPGYAQTATDVSSAEKKKKNATKKQQDEENLKTAPTAPPKGKSTY